MGPIRRISPLRKSPCTSLNIRQRLSQARNVGLVIEYVSRDPDRVVVFSGYGWIDRVRGGKAFDGDVVAGTQVSHEPVA